MGELDNELGLIRQSLGGDLLAFEELIVRYQPMIHNLTYRMTGSLADADDLAQDAFIQAFRQLSNYRGDSRFSSWLYRIAVNQSLNWKKKQARVTELHTEWSRQSETESSSPDSRSQHVQDALLKLHPKQRAAIILTVYDGLNHAAAAKALGCSETTVSWRIFAGRAKLKKILQKAFHEK